MRTYLREIYFIAEAPINTLETAASQKDINVKMVRFLRPSLGLLKSGHFET